MRDQWIFCFFLNPTSRLIISKQTFTRHKRCSQLVSEEVQHGCYGRGSQTRGTRHCTPQCTCHCTITVPTTVPLTVSATEPFTVPVTVPLLYPSLYLPLYRHCTCHCTCLTGCILSSVHPECEFMVSVVYLELIQLQ